MANKIIVFGDSFLYGHETNYNKFVEMPNFKKNFKKAVGVEWKLMDDGKFEFLKLPNGWKLMGKWFQWLYTLDNREAQHCASNSIGGYLSRELHVKDYINFAVVGCSNNFIMYKVIKHYKEITKNTLVVCGITSPLRDTKYEVSNAQVEHKLASWETEITDPGDDDLTSRVIQVFAYTQAIKQIVESRGGRVVFVDPFGNFAQDEYHSGNAWNYVKLFSPGKDADYKHHDELKIIDTFNREHFAPGFSSLFKWSRENNISMFCPGGHYSKEIYKQYTKEYLVPYLRDKNVI